MAIPYSHDQEGQKVLVCRRKRQKLIYAALSLYGRKQRITWPGFGINLFTLRIGRHARIRQMLTIRPGEE
jgi:hypothetical protein